MKYKSYPKYKDSGVEWIDDIPEGWRISKIKHLANIRISNVDKKTKENEPEVLLCNYTDVYNNEDITSKLDFMKATASNEQIKKLSLIKDDVIITKDSESPDDIAVPALVNKNLDNVVCGYHLALIRPNKFELDGNFLFRSLQNKKINDQFVVAANGVTRFGISTYPIKNSYLIIPPFNEQVNISSFLDKKTSELAKTIEKDTQLIELLQEKRIALINHAVTKGLDPDAKMKDSGVEWVREIPEDWEIVPLNKFTTLVTDYVANGSFSSIRANVQYKDEEDYAILLRLVDNSNKFKGQFVYIDEHAYHFLSKTKLNPGDIILSNVGATLGTVFRAPNLNKPMSLAPNVLLIRAKDEIASDYIYYWLKSNIGQYSIKRIVTETTQPKFNKGNFRKLPVISPPINEKGKIINFIENENYKIERIIDKIQNKVKLMEEYKKSLIHHVVTGRVDVRGDDSLNQIHQKKDSKLTSLTI